MWIEKCWTSSPPLTMKQVCVYLLENPASIVVQSSWCSSGSVKCRGVDAHMTLKAMLLWGVALNRCCRWRLKTRDMVVAPPSAAGTHMETHQVSTCTVSIPPLCRRGCFPLHIFSRSVVEQGPSAAPGTCLFSCLNTSPSSQDLL